MATAKSNETTLCTESTSGAASPASMRYVILYRCQWIADPRQPIAPMPKSTCFQRLSERSRNVARSGMRPTYQNNSDTVKYVETANTSHTSGLRHCGHSPMVFGYGSSQ